MQSAVRSSPTFAVVEGHAQLYGIDGHRRLRPAMLMARFAEAGVRSFRCPTVSSGINGNLKGGRKNAKEWISQSRGCSPTCGADYCGYAGLWAASSAARRSCSARRPRPRSPGFTMVRRRRGSPAFLGATDEYGYHAVQDKVHMRLARDAASSFRFNHEKLTYRRRLRLSPDRRLRPRLSEIFASAV